MRIEYKVICNHCNSVLDYKNSICSCNKVAIRPLSFENGVAIFSDSLKEVSVVKEFVNSKGITVKSSVMPPLLYTSRYYAPIVKLTTNDLQRTKLLKKLISKYSAVDKNMFDTNKTRHYVRGGSYRYLNKVKKRRKEKNDLG